MPPKDKTCPEEPCSMEKPKSMPPVLMPFQWKGCWYNPAGIMSSPKEIMEAAIVDTQKFLTIYRGFYTKSIPRDCTPVRMAKSSDCQSYCPGQTLEHPRLHQWCHPKRMPKAAVNMRGKLSGQSGIIREHPEQCVPLADRWGDRYWEILPVAGNGWIKKNSIEAIIIAAQNRNQVPDPKKGWGESSTLDRIPGANYVERPQKQVIHHGRVWYASRNSAHWMTQPSTWHYIQEYLHRAKARPSHVQVGNST